MVAKVIRTYTLDEVTDKYIPAQTATILRESSFYVIFL